MLRALSSPCENWDGRANGGTGTADRKDSHCDRLSCQPFRFFCQSSPSGAACLRERCTARADGRAGAGETPPY